MEWTLRRPGVGCEPRERGDTPFTAVIDEATGRPNISWANEFKALGVFVTDADAKIPLGPGMVIGGTTFLSLQSEAFPMGFDGPVTPEAPVPMGAQDTTATNGGTEGGAAIPEGTCVKVFVLFEGFKITEKIFAR